MSIAFWIWFYNSSCYYYYCCCCFVLYSSLLEAVELLLLLLLLVSVILVVVVAAIVVKSQNSLPLSEGSECFAPPSLFKYILYPNSFAFSGSLPFSDVVIVVGIFSASSFPFSIYAKSFSQFDLRFFL